jgi:uncharacterized protein DUF2752
VRLTPLRELRATWLAAAVLVGGGLLPPSWAAAGPPLCPFRLLTGLPCPGCGLTRSLVSLLHGDLSAAVFFHPLGPVAAGAVLAVVFVELRRTWQAGNAGVLAPAPPSNRCAGRAQAINRLGWLGVAAVLVVWLLRLPLFLQGRWLY